MKAKIKLHDTQRVVWHDPHRFKVVCAGRRWGKSLLARTWILSKALETPGGLFWIVTPTYQMAKDIFWKQGFLAEFSPSAFASVNQVDLEIVTEKGARIALRSADRPERLVGVKLNGLVIDEVATIKDFDYLWETSLRPTLTDYQAQAMFISTPKGYNCFYDLWIKGQQENSEWKSWRFTTYDNPFISKEEIEKAKQELDEDTFAQEYLAEFKKYVGLVYKDFSREKHIIEPIELQSNWTYYRAIDFGFVNPTAVVFAAITDKGELIVWDEIYQSGLQTPDLAELIKQKSVGKYFAGTFADSEQASDIAELQRYGIAITPVSKKSGTNEGWTTFRIRKVTEKLRNGILKIFRNCENLIFEMENYKYHEVRSGTEVKEVPMKINDHLLDALSYLVCSLPERIEPTFEENFEPIPKQNLFDKDGFY